MRQTARIFLIALLASVACMNPTLAANWSSTYGEWHPLLSFGKLGSKDLGFGPVKDVLLDVGNFKDAPDRLYVGIEYQYWQNKYGLDGREDNLVQAMVKWFF